MTSTQESTAAFDAIAAEYFPRLNGPGMAVAVVKGDQILWAQGYGWAEIEANLQVTTDTAFLLASGSKMFTATALMQLYERGLFALDDDVNLYLPFEVRHPAYPDIPITFRMLLSHGASLGDNWELMTCSFDGSPVTPLGEALRAYFDPATKGYRQAENFMPWAPGTAAAYNNVGYALLGYLVERIAGQPFEDYCQAHLFRPLDLRASFLQRGLDDRGVLSAMPYDRPGRNPRFVPYGRYECWMYPAATLRTDVLSYARFLLLHMNGGKLSGSPRMLDPTTTTMMHTSAYLDVPGYWGTRQPWYGMGFMTGAEWGAGMVGHEGGYVGVYSYAFFHEPTKVGVVILVNGETMDLKEFWLLTDAMAGRLMEVASATSQ